jgi:hypothetical protein
MSVRAQLLTALNSLTTPPKESVWIGPFDQLVSSAYALLKADELEFTSRSIDDYYQEVFCLIVKLVSELAGGQKSSDSKALKSYQSGIYFNAGFQRLTWAAERLVTTFAAVRCTCNRPPDVVKEKGRWDFGKSKEAAKKRLKHNHFGKEVDALEEMLKQFDGWDRASYEPTKALSILREQVNPKKHSVYDHPLVRASRPWINLTDQWKPANQMSLVVGAFEAVCKAYVELLSWNPGASLH